MRRCCTAPTSSRTASLVLAEETGVGAQIIFQRAIAALIALGRGEHELAAGHVAAGEAISAAGAHHPFGLELLLLTRSQVLERDGDAAGAAELLGLVWDQTADLRGLIQWRIVGPELVRLARVVGDVELAESVAADVVALAGRSSSVSGLVAAERAQGLAADDAEVLLRAVERARGLPRVIDRAAACEEAALLLLGDGGDQEAVKLLDEAASLHEMMGANRHLARIDAHLRQAGARRRRSQPAPAKRGWESLTLKEREVVELATVGLSNPEIASRLYISRRTVETHLSNVFRKLDLSNRTQLAAARLARADQ